MNFFNEKEKKVNNTFVTKLTMIAGKISNNKYIAAIRDAFANTIPITITAAFFLLVNNVLLDPKTGFIKNMPGADFIRNVGTQAYNGTLGILGLLVTFMIGAKLAKEFKFDEVIARIVSVGSFIALIPNVITTATTTGSNVKITAALTQVQTSASSMILGILAALIGTRLLIMFNTVDRLKIRMPESVPPGVAKAFNALFPSFITITIFSIIEETTLTLTGMPVPDLISKLLQAPLVGGFQTLPGILLYVFLSTSVFIFGINGAFVFGAISEPILLSALQQNIDAIKLGHSVPNMVTQPFLDAFVYMGGGGTMICLVIALLIFSKRPDERLISKIGGVPSLFNISEPIMFGLPIVFNPMYAIPFIVTPMVSTTIAYICTSLHWINPTYIFIPWVTPPIISGYLATSGDIRASIMQAVITVIGVLIYAPFVLASNRLQKNKE
ncbi:PTS sugar transporter subunit IIC [Pediococcus pentosaceus]|nr:PTS sugar transporter subunit IIC [Pediococcus pentosaceus]